MSDRVKELVENDFSMQVLSLRDNAWIRNIPALPGWYYIETDAPASALAAVGDPPSEYINDDGEVKKCRNYCIPTRVAAAADISGVIPGVISDDSFRPVYSGMTMNLQSRSREHTYGHPGTAGLSLSRYPEIADYLWVFRFQVFDMPKLNITQRRIALKYGEQVWRANNGWPILCAG